ncbi:MAG: transcriptional repressor [Candidatus Omnitrophica bacterium]|nr:transcriptional repressor [Candidatus Omnitrophota bacterium]
MKVDFCSYNDTLSHMSRFDSRSTSKIDQERGRFLKHLARTGLRVSRGRELIFNEVMQIHGHFTAEQLTKKCQKKNLKVSRPTVFRILHDLLAAGVIRETAFGDKHRHFEHVYDEKPHHHAFCIYCHGFIEFPDMKEDMVYHSIIEKKGFKILGHEMHFYGMCRKCQEKAA